MNELRLHRLLLRRNKTKMFSHLKNPTFDSLYCSEEHFDDEFYGVSLGQNESESEFPSEFPIKSSTFLSEHQHHQHLSSWDDDEVVTLLSKEKKQARLSYCLNSEEDGSSSSLLLRKLRNGAVLWMLKVVAHYGFNALTAVLAVNYYDGFVTSVSFQKDKPWMSQLASVACLSLAAKVEETHVPILLDFQVEDTKYVFEAKTIRRMELLVLSTLQWKMHPVTPISFFDHIARRFEWIKMPHWEFMRRCENVMLSIIKDFSFVHYHPSVIAASTMCCVIQEVNPFGSMGLQNQMMGALRTSKEEIDDCHKLIMEAMYDSGPKPGHKHKIETVPSSPSGVIDGYFSCDSSNDSWSVASSVSSSPEPLIKRICRAHNQMDGAAS